MQANDLQNICLGCMQPNAEVEATCPHCGYAGEKNLPHQLAAGSVLDGRYLIGRVLGQGGFGITYVAMDLNLQTRVAIKEYYPEGLVSRDSTGRGTVYAHTGQGETLYAMGRERFLQEARVLAQFQYLPGIVTVRDYFNANHTAYIVMEYIEGVTLKKTIVQAGGRLPSAPLLAQLEPLMESLEIVHSTNLLHRDISPDNIMVRPDGSFVLLDFGAARQFSVEGEHSNTVNVKHGYAPPEQYRTRGNQGPWTDVYALCATIYKTTTGLTPPQSVDRMAGDELPPPRKLGADLTPHQEAALLQGMAISVAERIASIKELRQALDANSQQPKRAAKAAPKPKQKTAAKHSGKKAWIGIAAGVLLFIGAGVFAATAGGAGLMQNLLNAAANIPALANTAAEPSEESGIDALPAEDFETEANDTGVTITGYKGTAAEIRIPDTIGGLPVTVIGDYAFMRNESLIAVTLPDNVTRIGGNAFSWCVSLKRIIMPNGVASIGSSAFSNCTSLSGIAIPDSVMAIGASAFSWCESLERIVIPNGISKIEASTFHHCKSLINVTIPDSVKVIRERAFKCCTALNKITIPGRVRAIRESAFEDCAALSTVIISQGVYWIGDGAFRGCHSLESVSIPESVQYIHDYVFEDCPSLSDVVVPNSEASIGKGNVALTRQSAQTVNSVSTTGTAAAPKATPKPAAKATPKPAAKATPKPTAVVQTPTPVVQTPTPVYDEWFEDLIETEEEYVLVVVQQPTQPEVQQPTQPEVQQPTQPEVQPQTEPAAQPETQNDTFSKDMIIRVDGVEYRP